MQFPRVSMHGSWNLHVQYKVVKRRNFEFEFFKWSFFFFLMGHGAEIMNAHWVYYVYKPGGRLRNVALLMQILWWHSFNKKHGVLSFVMWVHHCIIFLVTISTFYAISYVLNLILKILFFFKLFIFEQFLSLYEFLSPTIPVVLLSFFILFLNKII